MTFLAALAIGVGLGLDAFNLRSGYDALSYVVITFSAVAVIISLAYSSARKDIKPILKNKIDIRKTLLVALLFAIAPLSLFLAYSNGDNITVLAPLQQTAMLLVVIGGILFLGERKYAVQKVIATTIAFVGVLLIIT